MKNFTLKTLLMSVLLCVGMSAWADDELFYTLTPTAGSNNSYASDCDVTINGITWNITGNSQMLPWRVGGKSLTNVDRTVYSKTTMGAAISKVELTVGAASSITVNSLKLTVASDADFKDVHDEVSETFAASSTITFTPTSGTEWEEDAYYKFTFNVTVSDKKNNKFVEFTNATFYKSNSIETPEGTVATPTFSPAAGTYTKTQNVTIASETDGATIYYTIDGTDPTEESAEYTGAISVSETTTIKAIAVKDGLTTSSIATAEYTIKEAVRFIKVSSMAEIKENTEYLLVNHDGTEALGAISSSIGTPVSVNENNGIISIVDEDVNVLTLSTNDTGSYIFTTSIEDNTLAWTSGNSLITNSSGTTWTISYTDGALEIANKADTSRKLQYNSSSPRFACYTSTQKGVTLYIKESPYTRNVNVDNFGTICLPFAVDAKDITGATFYEITGKVMQDDDLKYICLEEVSALEAGVGYLFKATANKINLVSNKTTVNTPVTGRAMVGTFTDIAIPNGNYMLSGNKLYKAVNDYGKMNAFRAYIDLSKVSEVSEAKGRILFADGYDEATGIKSIATDAAENGAIYNVAGQRVNAAYKGIVIKNGKKYIAR